MNLAGVSRAALLAGILYAPSADWQITDNLSLLATVKNLVDGFPEEGRNYTFSLRWRN